MESLELILRENTSFSEERVVDLIQKLLENMNIKGFASSLKDGENIHLSVDYADDNMDAANRQIFALLSDMKFEYRIEN